MSTDDAASLAMSTDDAASLATDTRHETRMLTTTGVLYVSNKCARGGEAVGATWWGCVPSPIELFTSTQHLGVLSRPQHR
jgi:hypothetical protein